MSITPKQSREFDVLAGRYEDVLDSGLEVSGEDSTYFAAGRVRWLAGRLERLGLRPATVLDFGCGTGRTVPLLMEQLRPERVIGIDPSVESIRVAQSRYAGTRGIEFLTMEAFAPQRQVDLVYTNGVLHHVRPVERDGLIAFVSRVLTAGGVWAVSDNTPWNPGARCVMRRLPFDRDAIPIRPGELVRLAAPHDLRLVVRDFLFVFPRSLSALRWCEPWLCKLPLGAQYMLLFRKSRGTQDGDGR